MNIKNKIKILVDGTASLNITGTMNGTSFNLAKTLMTAEGKVDYFSKTPSINLIKDHELASERSLLLSLADPSNPSPISFTEFISVENVTAPGREYFPFEITSTDIKSTRTQLSPTISHYKITDLKIEARSVQHNQTRTITGTAEFLICEIA
ncbi:hypothetical protein [Pseudomonas sp. HS6]|uniref:hypothetical protein n=1 Tax=Pseudomonas sp. HS6 TaxID=2850559 RepID=UPI00201A0BA3|nr:hypothetical protein [Pseudomonas sp. HS6]UQS17782.1 hypothetical protein JJN09_13245 [Pseudomonas sp. HS6]